MLVGLFILSLICVCYEMFKGKFTPIIPAENWRNEELYRQDLMNGASVKQCVKNAAKGKYKLVENYPEPHRDPVSGKILIENYKLYKEDVLKYGAVQTMKWVKQGKYNLSPEELAKSLEEYKILN